MLGIIDLYHALAQTHMSPTGRRVYPRLPLLGLHPGRHQQDIDIPALLNAYLRMGAKVCGEPAWDPQFNVADFFLLLPVEELSPRYARHFTERQHTLA